MSAPTPKNTPLTWALTLLVLLVGGSRAWDALEPAPSASTPAASATSGATAEPAGAWSIEAREDLGDLRMLRWSEVREVRRSDGGDRGPLDGKLTLHFSERVQQSYPVVDGRVDVPTHRIQLLELTRSHRLGVEWKGHATRWVELPWLVELGAPEVLEEYAGDTSTRVVVRNRSIRPMDVEVRGGWRKDKRWVNDPDRGENSAGRRVVTLPPGATESIELQYAAGPAGATLAAPIVRPLF